MSFKKTVVVCSLALVAVAANPVAAQQRITNWPADVPCYAIQGSPDGQIWTQTKAVIVGNALLSGNMFRNTPETRVWNQKCGTHQ
jgi:hypothetical protein